MNVNRPRVIDAGMPGCHIMVKSEDGWHRMIYRTDGQWFVACLELQNSKRARTACERSDIVRLTNEETVREYECQ